MSEEMSIDTLYNQKVREIARSSIGYPLGEIIQLPFKSSDETLKLLDENQIVNKSNYPDLYKIIGDYYTDYYTNLYRLGEIPLANKENGEFMLPNLSGRYLVQRNPDDSFELTPAAFQSFKIVISNQFAKVASWNEVYNSFKSNDETIHKVALSDKPIQNVKLLTNFKEENLDSETININDKCINFYMRVK